MSYAAPTYSSWRHSAGEGDASDDVRSPFGKADDFPFQKWVGSLRHSATDRAVSPGGMHFSTLGAVRAKSPGSARRSRSPSVGGSAQRACRVQPAASRSPVPFGELDQEARRTPPRASTARNGSPSPSPRSRTPPSALRRSPAALRRGSPRAATPPWRGAAGPRRAVTDVPIDVRAAPKRAGGGFGTSADRMYEAQRVAAEERKRASPGGGVADEHPLARLSPRRSTEAPTAARRTPERLQRVSPRSDASRAIVSSTPIDGDDDEEFERVVIDATGQAWVVVRPVQDHPRYDAAGDRWSSGTPSRNPTPHFQPLSRPSSRYGTPARGGRSPAAASLRPGVHPYNEHDAECDVDSFEGIAQSRETAAATSASSGTPRGTRAGASPSSSPQRTVGGEPSASPGPSPAAGGVRAPPLSVAAADSARTTRDSTPAAAQASQRGTPPQTTRVQNKTSGGRSPVGGRVPSTGANDSASRLGTSSAVEPAADGGSAVPAAVRWTPSNPQAAPAAAPVTARHEDDEDMAFGGGAWRRTRRAPQRQAFDDDGGDDAPAALPPLRPNEHRVMAGETWEVIAEIHMVDVYEIVTVNHVSEATPPPVGSIILVPE